MKAYFYKVLGYVLKLQSKIAFYPTIISLAGFLFAFFMYYIENLEISKYLVEHVPWLVINNVDTARAILTTFVAGLISIMVFSFSMVMILLSQASSNFSPRVLPGLISNRRHQIILGIYNACLLYCIFTLIAIEPSGSKYQLPGFSVLLAIVFMTFCLGAFIYFIHSISQEIQINNIMSAIFNKAKARLNKLIDSEKDLTIEFPNSNDWYIINSETSGYLEDISLISIFDEVNKHKIKADIVAYKGDYIVKGFPLIKIEKSLEEEIIKKISSAFNFSKSELIEDNYVLAFKQTTEIAVKAMSPGINDPGTAVNAIDYLTELFLLRMQKKDTSYYCNKSGDAIIHIRSIDFKTLLYSVMAALRTYCKHDIIIVQKLAKMLSYLLHCNNCVDKRYKKAVEKEIDNLYADASNSLKNKNDLEVIEKYVALVKVSSKNY
tara:strand:- start:1854 stop:3158 length:1305 start_codon:yes stop_codon:yes gene_type:complete